jgi:hypothetical protein
MKNFSCLRDFAFMAVLLVAGSWSANAADQFSLSVGSHDLLIVSDANGTQRAELPLPSISQSITVGNATFQVSYGRDASNLLTAILSPNPAEPQDLHFSVMGKSVDSDKLAVVTLTFSKEAQQVKIDPGYVGQVMVNSRALQHDSAVNRPMQHADVSLTATSASQDLTTPTDVQTAATPHSAVAAASTTVSSPTPPAPPVTVPVPDPTASVAANQPANVTDPSEAADGHVSDHAPLPMQANDASQMPFTATATPGPSTVSASGPETAPKQHTLYWAEPITSPNGSRPPVASNQMKLIELKGSVSVTPPGGASEDATEGMIVPSGSTIHTSTGAAVALFMGGVNSVRFMPDSEVQVTQELNGSVRKTVVALRQGTVFNRVGHQAGETQNYQVESPEGVAIAKGTEFADSIADGHHYVFVVKGIVATLINGIQTGNLTPTTSHLAFGAMPPADNGDKILFAILTALQPFQTHLQTVIAHINSGTATPAELGYFDSLRNTFSVAVDDVYDPTHPNSFLGAFTSGTGFGDSAHSSLERPQDFSAPNPDNPFSGFQQGVAQTGAIQATSSPALNVFSTPALDPLATPISE